MIGTHIGLHIAMLSGLTVKQYGSHADIERPTEVEQSSVKPEIVISVISFLASKEIRISLISQNVQDIRKWMLKEARHVGPLVYVATEF